MNRYPGSTSPGSLANILSEIAIVWSVLGVWLGVWGPIAPLMVMSGAAGLAAVNPHRLIFLTKLWPLLLIGVLAVASAIWSAEPAVSARYGFQLLITIAVGGIILVTCSIERILRGVFIACSIVLLLSVLSGRQGLSASGPVLIGVLGSKNEMGSLCFILLASAVSLAFSKSQPLLFRRAAFPVAAFAGLFLIQAFSAGAVLGALIFFVISATLILASKLSGSAKFILCLTIIAIVMPLWLIRADLASIWNYILVDVLNKDAGLTGRDYLWAHADALIEAEPLLGHGYRSTWLGHGVDTIGLLRWAGLQSGEGFNFHNTYREWLVDFGFVGALLIVVSLGVGMVRGIVMASGKGTTAPLLFFVSMGLVFTVRGYFEYIFGPFSAVTLFVILAAGAGYFCFSQNDQSRNIQKHL